MLSPKTKQYTNTSFQQDEVLPLKKCLAKTRITEKKMHEGGRNVFDHCSIVGEIAKELLTRMPSFLRSSLFPDASELIAAIHDIGKVSPTFQEKIYRGIDGYVPNSMDSLAHINPDLERNWGYHAGISMAAAQFLKTDRVTAAYCHATVP